MSEIYYGRGTHEQFDEYIDLIDVTFGFKKGVDDFPIFLPKLYRPELDPAYNSFNAYEDGKMIAAVGAFPGEVNVAGTVLRGVGIGNVAVHPDHRSKGYMKTLMTMAVDDMVANGIDFSALGGQRQRYNFFSYENLVNVYNCDIARSNLRFFCDANTAPLTFTEVAREDDEALDAIDAIIKSKPYYPIRDRAELYAVCCSWNMRPFVFKRGDKIVGYAVGKGGSFSELNAADEADLFDMIHTLVALKDKVSIKVPEFNYKLREVLEPICADMNIICTEMFTVLCYRRVIEAYLRLKGTYAPLSDGRMVALIHGRGGDENIAISVCGGEVKVEQTTDAPDVELEHLEAMKYFFSYVSPSRHSKGPAVANEWFPLPLWAYSADNV